MLRALLKSDQTAAASRASWTRAQVVDLIEHRFGAHYHPQSIPALLQRWRITLSLAPAVRGDARPSPTQLQELSVALAGSPSDAGFCTPRWEQRHIAQFLQKRFGLQYPTRGLYRRMKRWGLAIPAPATAGGACALTNEQRRTLAATVAEAPVQCGYNEANWSRKLVGQFILERFNVRYAPASIPHVLRREGLRLRPPPTSASKENSGCTSTGPGVSANAALRCEREILRPASHWPDRENRQ